MPDIDLEDLGFSALEFIQRHLQELVEIQRYRAELEWWEMHRDITEFPPKPPWRNGGDA
jgi:hypothetical protein